VHRYGAGLATDPDVERAVADAVAAALEPLAGARPDLLVVFASEAYGGDAARAGPLAFDEAAPRTLIGAVAANGVIGAGRELEHGRAVSVLAASFPEAAIEVFHSLADLGGVPEVSPDALTVLIADPYTFPTDALIEHLAPEQPLVGGLAGGGGAGMARLFRDGGVLRAGAVGVVLPASLCAPLVSQGCRPIGPELVVTAAIGNALLELAGTPALEKIEEVFGTLSAADQALARNGLLSGLVIDENRPEYGIGDYLVRVLLGADRERGAVLIGDVPRVGQTFRLHVRDEASASAELEHVLRAAPAGRGALVFSCNGRGRNLFSTDDHDAGLVEELLGVPAAGLFCQGEIGPVGGRNHLHGFTATIALLS
jgi:small ligand-binding sensory domain FIST